MTVSWTAPSEDGGSPITGYFIERQSNVSPRWTRINRTAVTDTSLAVDDLVEGTEYMFRIIAVNVKGESKPSQPSENVLAKNPFGMYYDILSIYYWLQLIVEAEYMFKIAEKNVLKYVP